MSEVKTRDELVNELRQIFTEEELEKSEIQYFHKGGGIVMFECRVFIYEEIQCDFRSFIQRNGNLYEHWTVSYSDVQADAETLRQAFAWVRDSLEEEAEDAESTAWRLRSAHEDIDGLLKQRTLNLGDL